MSRVSTDNEMIFSEYFGVPPTNRTKFTVTGVKNCHSLPIPDITGFNKPLEEIISARAKQIKSYDNVALMLSGGIDSTLAFYAMIDEGIEFTVISTDKLREEYELVYNQLKNNEIENVKEFILLDDIPASEVLDLTKYTLVTGELGDQMVGSDKFFSYTIHELNTPYQNHIPKQIQDEYGEPVKAIIGNYGTTSQYLWALNFIYKFAEVVIRFRSYNSLKDDIKVAHFFNTVDFQKWAIVNHKENTSFDRMSEYKFAYKDYIFSKNGDQDYRNFKMKIGSAMHMVDPLMSSQQVNEA